MRKPIIIGISCTAAILFGVFLFHQPSTVKPKNTEGMLGVQSATVLKGSSTQAPGTSSIPAPPPKLGGGKPVSLSADNVRSLVGTTTEQLREIEKALPAGTRIATYPISDNQQRAAVATSDLIGDGRQETVIIYNTTDSTTDEQPLWLGVLSQESSDLTMRTSTRLYGNIIYASIYDQQSAPFVIRDITGDSRREIVVTSGVGASIGGAIQVYSFDGSSLNRLAFAEGHTLRLSENNAGHAAEISAQSRYEDRARRYRWNGNTFVAP